MLILDAARASVGPWLKSKAEKIWGMATQGQSVVFSWGWWENNGVFNAICSREMDALELPVMENPFEHGEFQHAVFHEGGWKNRCSL